MKNYINMATKKMIEELNSQNNLAKKLSKIGPDASKTVEAALSQKVEIINRTKKLDRIHSELFFELVDSYFSLGRPRYFGEFEKIMSPRFAEVINLVPFEQLTIATSRHHQLAKTSRPQNYDDLRQKHISVEVLEPFLNRLKSIQKDDPIPELNYKIQPDNILILTLHAVTEGMYAPGKMIFSIAKSLVEKVKKVQVISLGIVDDKFVKLMKENSNFEVVKLDKYTDDSSVFHWLRRKINELKPAAIITEIEVSILVAIEICKLPSPIFLVSAGFYRIPWHSGIFMAPELEKQTENFKIDRPIFSIPQTHEPENLAPYCDPVTLAKAKAELNISDKFVIASFARYEQFSDDFLLLIKSLLEKVPNSVVILAGPNAQVSAQRDLQDFITEGRVNLLGVRKISVLGYCCDVFLDTFPIPTGFAALESMAKGKPVFSLDCNLLKEFQSFLGVSRVKRLIFELPEQLITSICKAEKDKGFYDQTAIESTEFVEDNFYNSRKLSDAFIKVINLVHDP